MRKIVFMNGSTQTCRAPTTSFRGKRVNTCAVILNKMLLDIQLNQENYWGQESGRDLKRAIQEHGKIRSNDRVVRVQHS